MKTKVPSLEDSSQKKDVNATFFGAVIIVIAFIALIAFYAVRLFVH